MIWQDISTAPKDRPILAWCDHEADPYFEPETPMKEVVIDGETTTIPKNASYRLTLYAAHADGLSHAPTGYHIIEWGGAFDDSTWEYPNQASLPDWWFVAGSEFEQAANPTHWAELPPKP